MSKLFNKINARFIKCYETAAVACIFIVIIATSVQVFTRYVLGAALVGTEEVARYSFVWANMLGASICVTRHSHAAVSFLSDQLIGNTKKIHSILIQLFILTVALLLIFQGINMLKITWKQVSPTLQFPMWMLYMAIPVGGIGIFLGGICNIINEVNSIMQREGES